MNDNSNGIGFKLVAGATIGLGVIAGTSFLVNWLGRKVNKSQDDEMNGKIQNQSPKLLVEKEADSNLQSKSLTVQSSSKPILASVPSTSSRLVQETAIKQEILRIDEQYGKVEISSFSPTWLQDYPQIIEHIESEHLLHVKGKDENEEGLTWHTEKFTTDMEPRLNPEAKVGSSLRGGFQMKLGYFLVPESKMKSYAALALSSKVVRDIKMSNDLSENCYRFFVHPEAYDHFRMLHQDDGIKYVSPEKSEFIGTPTSSYRSWVVRRVEQNPEESTTWLPGKDSIPFVVKLGVTGSVLGSDRWLSPNEIERSVQAQIAFDLMPSSHFKKGDGADLFIFSENLGLVLQNVPGYPKSEQQSDAITKESGLLIREFPKKFLEGKCKIVSMAALMSPERVKHENHGVGLSSTDSANQGLPLIFDVMAATIKAGHVKTPQEFIERYLVKGYLSAIENVVFQEGLTLEPHSQNLCMVLNNDLTPKGFAYRDHGGIWIDIATRGLQDKDISPFYRVKGDGNKLFKTKGAIAKGYIGSYAWFYRYQVVVKMLNMITRMQSDGELMPPPTGAPYQIGKNEKLPERNLQKYIFRKIETEYPMDIQKVALQTLQQFSLDMQAYQEIINLLDSSYLELMNRYFDLPKIGIQLEAGSLPSAEGGSPGEKVLYQHKGFLGKYRFQRISSQFTRLSMEQMPEEVLNKVKERVITSFENQSFDDVHSTEWMVTNRGLCFFDKEQNIVAFMPFSYEEEKVWVEKQLRSSS